MTNKRKSISIGDNVHALSAEGAQSQIYLRSKGFRDAALTSLGVWDPTGIACQIRFLVFEVYPKNYKKDQICCT